MKPEQEQTKEPEQESFDGRFDGTRLRQMVELGRSMTPLKRLRWLEERMASLRRLQGVARDLSAPSTSSL